MRLATEMEAEAQAHVALGLSADQKPIFDLLFREDLSRDEIKQIKSASVAVLEAIKTRMTQVHDIFQKQATRARLRQDIYDLLYDEKTGLPAAKYDDSELEMRTDQLFQFFEQRFTTPHSIDHFDLKHDWSPPFVSMPAARATNTLEGL